ncbi:hypothetical protein AB0C21_22470 [Spirillospora sp. NPDC049024]
MRAASPPDGRGRRRATRRAESRVAKAFAGRALDAPALAEVDAATARAPRAEIA